MSTSTDPPSSGFGHVIRSHRRPSTRLGWRIVLLAAALLGGLLFGAVQLGIPANAQVQAQPVSVIATAWPSPYGSLSGMAGALCQGPGQWPSIARANGLSAPYWVYAGRSYVVPCAVRPAAAPPRAVQGGQRAAAPAWVHPLAGAVCGGRRFHVPWEHFGQDLGGAGVYGRPIRAVGAGVVAFNGYERGGAGWYVKVNHGRYWSVYMHMRARSPVGVGTRVRPGSVVGYVGSTGDSTGPHLHFEVRVGSGRSAAVDPVGFMVRRGVRLCA